MTLRSERTLEAKRVDHKSARAKRRFPWFCAATIAALAIVSDAPPARSEAPPAAPSVASEDLNSALQAFQKRIRELNGSASVAIVDVQTGEVVAALDANAPKNPASNAKLLTAAAVLRRLGPSRRIPTGLYGELKNGVVPQLVLRGQGDPMLSTDALYELARELRDRGIERVGSIAVDQSYFDAQMVPPAFDQQPNEWAPFRAPVAAVSLDENTITFAVVPAEVGKNAKIRVFPRGFVDIEGSIDTAKKGSADKLGLTLSNAKGRLAAVVSGSVPEGAMRRYTKRIEDPTLFAGYALREVLIDLEIKVDGGVKAGGGSKTQLAIHYSPPISELLLALGKASDNFVAEMLFKQLGAGPKGTAATAARAGATVRAELEALGVSTEGVVVANGSGLFDANRVSASTMTALLRAMATDPNAVEFMNQLAIGGVDGTLRGRFKAYADRRAVRAKTGTLRAVAALSGYAFGPPGTSPLAFAIFVNDVPDKVGAAREAMDRVVVTALEERWKGHEKATAQP